MTDWAFQPLNDFCWDCEVLIAPMAERNYIAWDSSGGCYRRVCASCYDAAKQNLLTKKKE